jgi:hypothetical protein
MSVIVKLKNPELLMDAIQNDIRQKKIKLWEIDDDGHLTHTPNKYYKKAWFSGEVNKITGEVTFKYIKPKNSKDNKSLYGMYHGRFIKMLLSNFYKKFEMESTEFK